MKELILATRSPYKLKLFRRLGIPFRAGDPPYEEVIDPDLNPKRVAEQLARGKARSLGSPFADSLIVAGDQVLALGEKVFTKPGNTAAAVAQLLELSGNTHALHTAVAVYEPDGGRTISRVVTSELCFYANLDPGFLTSMVEADQSQNCVGGYKFESKGILLVREVRTPDPNAIVGLPLIALMEILRPWGFLADRFASEGQKGL